MRSACRARGNQPSQMSTTRWRVCELSPPRSTGGWGFWAGLGHDQMGSKFTNLPWNWASSLVHISFIARTCSSRRLKRVENSVPWFSISSRFQPPPMPKRKRPSERKSRLATSFAIAMVSRSMTRQMPVPTLSRLVTAAANISDTNGS